MAGHLHLKHHSFVDACVKIFGRGLAWPIQAAIPWTNRRLGIAVVFHRIGDPQGDPDSEFVPSRGSELFRSQVRYMAAHYNLVTASQLPAAIRSRRRGERIPLAITFDDDLSSHRVVALPILRDVGGVATFFLCGASLDHPYRFWWERLQVALEQGMLETIETEWLPGLGAPEPTDYSSMPYRIGSMVQSMTPSARDTLSERLASVIGPDPDDAGMRTSDVRELADAGCEIGFHTLRHHPLPSLDDDVLLEALTDGRKALEQITRSPIRVIAYPHGTVDDRVLEALSAAQYDYGYTLGTSPATPETNPLLLGRIEPSMKSTGHFALRLAHSACSP